MSDQKENTSTGHLIYRTMIKKFARFILLLQLFEGRTIQTPWYNHKIYFCALVTLFLLKMSRSVLENSSLIGNVCIAGGL
jgi:hypothetical protein